MDIYSFLQTTYSFFYTKDSPPSEAQYEQLRHLQRRIERKFDFENNEAELKYLHSLLHVGEFERIGRSWSDAGFQQSDPVSDIRG